MSTLSDSANLANGHGHKEFWAVGEKAFFEYHCLRCHSSGDAEAWYRDHQPVEIIEVMDSDGKDWYDDGATLAERACEAISMLYLVRFSDGHEHEVFEDELLVSPNYYFPEYGPPPTSEIEAARAAATA